jgi:hypothetical protein
MSVGNTRTLPEGAHPLIEPWPGQGVSRGRIHKHAVCGFRLQQLVLCFQREQKFGVHRQNDSLTSFLCDPFHFLPVEMNFAPGELHCIYAA